MSIYHSDKIDEFELAGFRQNVIDWLKENFNISGLKIRAYNCYGGDVRIYLGTYQEFPNNKESFRRKEAVKDEKGNITGWNGTRGIHTRKYPDYITINYDEFEEIKKCWENKSGDNYYFYNDLIFRRLTKRDEIIKALNIEVND